MKQFRAWLAVGFGGENCLQSNPICMNVRNDENLHAVPRRARIIDEIEEVLDDRSKQGSHTSSQRHSKCSPKNDPDSRPEYRGSSCLCSQRT